MGVSNVMVKDSTDAVTYVAGEDFTVDPVAGTVTLIAGGDIADGAEIHATYNYANPAGVTDAMVIGTHSPAGAAPADGVSCGLQLLPMAFSTFGFHAKILIAPGYADAQGVASALTSMAARVRAICYIDTALDTVPTVQTALSQRGSAGTAFGTSHKRAEILYPNLLDTDYGVDPAGAAIVTPRAFPYSAFKAGVRAAKDLASGYWHSDSNTPILGALGPDVALYMSAFDATSDTNQLNAAGITTVFNGYGSGLRTWGNRSSAYPTATAPDVFVCIRRTLDIFEESLEQFSLQFLDGSVTNALIQSVLDAANAFCRTLIQRGAFLPGSRAYYDPNENPASELAAGHITFSYDVMPPPPAERITHRVAINIALLSGLGQTQPGA